MKSHPYHRRDFLKSVSISPLLLSGLTYTKDAYARGMRPNILWINAEDMSPHFSCYGETLIQTPNIDRLAKEGERYVNTFVTAPVCSPSRSALITGMYQTTLGAHNHRSQRIDGKGSGNIPYYKSFKYPEGMKSLPQLFQEQGYYIVNGGLQRDHLILADEKTRTIKQFGKFDFNFVFDLNLFDSDDWKNRESSQPFFAQIQLPGGKDRSAEVENPVNPNKVKLPPYYPDHEVLRNDWANYLNSIIKFDHQVGDILDRLDREGLAENTVVVLFTDHGISHARGKQFLYDDGIRIPLIIRWPGKIKSNSVRQDLISHIDIAATSLDIAGIPIPDYIQGRSLYSPTYKPRTAIFAARDRCDETVDIIRCVRTKRYKYIRNYYPWRPHAQANQYKDGKQIMQTMRNLYRNGKLDQVQKRLFEPTRPPEELYDLEKDPHEIQNLAKSAQHQHILQKMRQQHLNWLIETNDLGLIPEPELEVLGKKYDNKYFVPENVDFEYWINSIYRVIALADQGKSALAELKAELNHKVAVVRYWAALAIGDLGEEKDKSVLINALNDPSASVRIAAASGLCKTSHRFMGLATLISELDNTNLIAQLYAILALEQVELGDFRDPIQRKVSAMRNGPYEFSRRVATRMMQNTV